ncbi:MAG TPA: LptA/OstA family protein [Terracidiphilus sp.]|nr:LptA/OstA family protein [Terracidiphilus sp.]
MHLSIERLRTLVLLAGGLLIVALVVFLELGHLRSRFNLRDVPKRLGLNVEVEENGFTLTRAHGGHTEFKMHASKMVRLKQGGRALLDDVEIELYGKDGATVDRIRGGHFEWNEETKKATAAGPVEILIMEPTATPTVAEGVRGSKPAKPKTVPTPLSSAAQSVAKGQIDVKTSGLTFDSNTGSATTAQRVEFATAQGSGSSDGATFDSDAGTLELDRAVELNVRRGDDTVAIHAQHAEFDRDQRTCDMRAADARYRNGEATAGQAHILFRENGSAVRLDAHDGLVLTTATGARIASPVGWLEFNEKNQPQVGRLSGGVTMASSGDSREASGSAPSADLNFSPKGDLRHAHLERGVILHSAQDGPGGARLLRDWRSPVADVEFRTTAQGRTEIEQVHGTGGVLISGSTQRAGAPATPSRMAADDVTGTFGAGQQLSELIGVGHASLEQTTATGAQQTTSGDRIDARFVETSAGRQQGAQQIQSAVIDGNVVMTDQERAKPAEVAPAPMRATAGHATYEGAGQWLHLTTNPRIEQGGLELTADTVDVSQASGDGFAHGNVKATWVASGKPGEAQSGIGIGGDGPAHVIAAEAQMHRATDEATFRGQARLWQGPDSVSAPVIVLNRTRQTLAAHGNGTAQPVNLVLLTAGGAESKQKSAAKPSGPQVVRVRAGDLKYSAAERRAVLAADGTGNVVAQSESATVSSREAELTLLPPGNHASSEAGAGQVDRMTARGHVVIVSNDRHGTGEMLVYTGDTGQYVLTGTAGAPPRMTDPVHGTVTGNTLIFNTRDDSVSIEGQGRKTSTETVAPK